MTVVAFVAVLALAHRPEPVAFVGPPPPAQAQPVEPPVSTATLVREALADARALPPDQAVRTRYFARWGMPEELRADTAVVVHWWPNKLSREAILVRARRVSDRLYAVDILQYGWDPATWEKLADTEPFFHDRIRVKVGKTFARYHRDGAGAWYTGPGWYEHSAEQEQTVNALARWLPQAEALELSTRTNSAVPLVRFEWFFATTTLQAGRKGIGYFDWLGFKKRQDVFDLVGFDPRQNERLKVEVAAIVARSGVAQLPRQIFRGRSVVGDYWVTKDALDNNQDGRNAVRQLDGDFKHQAEEHVFQLPNGLEGYYLCDQNGVQQESAPDRIGPDTTAPGRDGRIHAGLCWRCHAGPLKPINDWARQAYSGPLKLASPDPVKAVRLRQLYLGELQEQFDADVEAYTRRIKRLTGLAPVQLSKTGAALYKWYAERDLLPADAAADLGVTEAAYVAGIKAYLRSNPLADPVLASHVAVPPLPIRGDDWEQLQPIVAPLFVASAENRP